VLAKVRAAQSRERVGEAKPGWKVQERLFRSLLPHVSSLGTASFPRDQIGSAE